jgi:hypothetical protein
LPLQASPLPTNLDHEIEVAPSEGATSIFNA